MTGHGLLRKVLQYCGIMGCILVLLLVVFSGNDTSIHKSQLSDPKAQHHPKKLVLHPGLMRRKYDRSLSRFRAPRIKSFHKTTTTAMTLQGKHTRTFKARNNTVWPSENNTVLPNINASSLEQQKKVTTTHNQIRKVPENVVCQQERRQKLLKDTCKYYKQKGDPTMDNSRYNDDYTYYMIMVDDVHKVLYCEVPKVACTSWKVFLANLTGRVDPKDYTRLHELVHDTTYYPTVGFKYLKDFNQTERMYRLNNYFKFMVVRNPIARLVSAYENKLVKVTDQSKFYQDTVGTYVIKKYRENPSNKSLTEGMDARLEELIKLILDESENFAYRFDGHWWRMQSLCYPCLFNYDYIAKLETLQNDLDYLLSKIAPGMKQKFPYLNSNSGREDQVTISRYFNKVSPVLAEKIKTFYEVDSKMFGYNINDNAVECH